LRRLSPAAFRTHTKAGRNDAAGTVDKFTRFAGNRDGAKFEAAERFGHSDSDWHCL